MNGHGIRNLARQASPAASYSAGGMRPAIVPLDNPVQNYACGSRSPEVGPALTRFVAVKALRSGGELARGLGPLHVPELATPLAPIEHPEGLRRLLAWLWSRPAEERVPLVERAVAAAARRRDEDA